MQQMQFFDGVLEGLLAGTLGNIQAQGLSAHILGPDYEHQASDKWLSDVANHQIVCADYSPQALLGLNFPAVDGSVSLTSDPAFFGSPVTFPVFKYLVLALGHPASNASQKRLFAFTDLAPSGALEVVRGSLRFTPPADGWVKLATVPSLS